MRPVVFFAFANNRVDETLYLRNLPEEQRQVRAAMERAAQAGLCEIVERANATAAEVLDVFQDPRYRGRVAVFHFGGHAGTGVMLFESPEGAPSVAHAGGLARFLGEQRSLELVFLNGCATQNQVQNLLAAGVPAVIATSQDVEDLDAKELASRFYAALSSGAPLHTAFTEATASVQALNGEATQPWNLHAAPGAEEHARHWSLPLAARNPLFGLPSLPAMDLPPLPFKSLAPFTREDALVFFGRGREIREIFEAVTVPDGAPIVLLFGATGAGKSSLLAAGLQSRLEASHEVLYLRRDGALGLTQTLARALPGSAAGLGAIWRQREKTTGKPLVVILDQAEEAWTRPLPGGGEAEEFAVLLRSLFKVFETRPQGRLVLGFRKEWLAEVLRLLDAEKLPRTRVEVTHLDQDGIEEAVAGVASNDRLKRQYRLEVDSGLPGLIAGDLLEDPGATVAPVLQILLTKMWAEATKRSPESPRFTVEFYQEMKRRGILLDDFLTEQLRDLRKWRPEVVGSGLALDLLAYHTTPLGTAETRLATDVFERYGRRQDIGEFLDKCKDLYLLTGTAPQTTRLAHDTLAPLVRQRFEASNLPGQLALRILEQRTAGWAGGKTGVPLDEFDLARVEAGQRGMRARTPDENRLVVASHQQADRRKRQRRSFQITVMAAIAIILMAALLAWRQRKQALVAEERSRDRAYAALAANLVVDRPTEAALLLLEVRQPDSTPTASNALQKTLAEPLEFATLPHTDGVVAASFSPDGTRVVTASLDNTARIWNAATGRLTATLRGHKEVLSDGSFSPDGTRVATASFDHTARIWNAATGQPITTLTGHVAPVWTARFNSDGTRVVTASWDQTARIWNAATGQLIVTLTGHTKGLVNASFSPDDTRVVTASWDGTARIWNAVTGQPTATLTLHTGELVTASFSPDSTRVVTAFRDGMARIWNAVTGQPVATLTGHTGAILTASFSPDGTRVVTASLDHTARIWNTVGGLVATLSGHTDALRAAAFSPDGTRVVTASLDTTACIWNTATGKPIATLTGHDSAVWTAFFSSDSTRVVTAAMDQTARIWNTATGQVATLSGHTEWLWDASFSLDSTRVVTASLDQTARIWDAATGQVITTLTGHRKPVLAASFSPDGNRVVTASRDQTARIWNATTGQPITILVGHMDAVQNASFSPDGTHVVTASRDKTVRIWNATTGQPITTLAGHTDVVEAASFSPDGTRLVTASQDHRARIWNTATGQSISVLSGHTDDVRTASFSPDSTRVLTASGDGTARIWNAATGQSIAVLSEHTGPLQAASFSPDGTRVVMACGDKTARIWNAVTGQPIAILSGHTGEVAAASFSPDGTRVVTASWDKTARIWPVDNEYTQSRVRARTTFCLQAEFRRVTLGESPQEAEAHEKACEACIPKFFSRLQGVPSGDAQTHRAAWEEYRECLDDAI